MCCVWFGLVGLDSYSSVVSVSISFGFHSTTRLYRMKTMIHCISVAENGNASNVESPPEAKWRKEWRRKKKPNTNAVDTYTVGNEEQKKCGQQQKTRESLGKWEIMKDTGRNGKKNRVVDIEKMLPQTDVGVSEWMATECEVYGTECTIQYTGQIRSLHVIY